MTTATKTAANSGFPEVQAIKNDLDSLRDDVVALTSHIQEEGIDAIQDATKKIRTAGNREYRALEKTIKANPTQSLAIAFCAGAVMSMLFGRR